MEFNKPTNNSCNENINKKYLKDNRINNLVEYYLKYNKVPLIQDKFELKWKSDVLEDTTRIKDKTHEEAEDTYLFKYRIEEIDFDNAKRLKIIRNIRDIGELEIWIQDFDKIRTYKKWDIKKQLIALGEVIVDQNLGNIFSMTNFKLIKKELRKHVVKKTSLIVIQMRLYKCKQEDYVYIREYISELKKLIDKCC